MMLDRDVACRVDVAGPDVVERRLPG